MVRVIFVLVVIGFVLFIALQSHGQEPPAKLQAADTGYCFQTVVVRDLNEKRIRQFTRYGKTRYGEWIEVTPVPRAIVDHYYIKEWRVTPQVVRRALGDELFELFNTHRGVTISGHFNLSRDARYDWSTFGGYTYTTRDSAKDKAISSVLDQ